MYVTTCTWICLSLCKYMYMCWHSYQSNMRHYLWTCYKCGRFAWKHMNGYGLVIWPWAKWCATDEYLGMLIWSKHTQNEPWAVRMSITPYIAITSMGMRVTVVAKTMHRQVDKWPTTMARSMHIQWHAMGGSTRSWPRIQRYYQWRDVEI